MENPNDDIAKAPLPSKKELNSRKNPIFQLFRFALINLKMLKIISKGHKS